MISKDKLAIAVVVFVGGYLLLKDAGYFKPTNYLECKNNRGKFYLKIIQSKKKAEEYPNRGFKESEIIKSFNLSVKKNYMMLSNDDQFDPPQSYTKTNDIFPINRKTLKIYDPNKKINLGQCITFDNKI